MDAPFNLDRLSSLKEKRKFLVIDNNNLKSKK